MGNSVTKWNKFPISSVFHLFKVLTPIEPWWRLIPSQISLMINGDIISKVPFFKNCNPGFINSVVELLRPEIYIPGDEIVTVGDVGTEMYFISQGQVEVVIKIKDTEKVVNTLGEGSFFGEIALLFESKRTATIRAKTYCDLFVLRKSDLDRVLKNFPGERVAIKQMAETRISKDSLRKTLNTDPLFTNVEPKEQVFAELVQLFQPQSYEENDFVFQYGDEETNAMYFIAIGTLEFIGADESVLRQVKVTATGNGCFFGDADFLLKRARSTTCRVVTKCTILVLSRQDYDTLMTKFPGCDKAIEGIAIAEESELIVTPKTRSKNEDKDWLQNLSTMLKEEQASKEDIVAALKMLQEHVKEEKEEKE